MKSLKGMARGWVGGSNRGREWGWKGRGRFATQQIQRRAETASPWVALLMTEYVQAQEGRSERNKEVKGSQVVSGLETGMERTRQKRPNSMDKEVTSCSRDRN
jgi:hypothetical protein